MTILGAEFVPGGLFCSAGLKAADASAAEFVQGRAGIHEMAIALEKADLSLRLLTQVRNRMIEAYREISRM